MKWAGSRESDKVDYVEGDYDRRFGYYEIITHVKSGTTSINPASFNDNCSSVLGQILLHQAAPTITSKPTGKIAQFCINQRDILDEVWNRRKGMKPEIIIGEPHPLAPSKTPLPAYLKYIPK